MWLMVTISGTLFVSNLCLALYIFSFITLTYIIRWIFKVSHRSFSVEPLSLWKHTSVKLQSLEWWRQQLWSGTLRLPCYTCVCATIQIKHNVNHPLSCTKVPEKTHIQILFDVNSKRKFFTVLSKLMWNTGHVNSKILGVPLTSTCHAVVLHVR